MEKKVDHLLSIAIAEFEKFPIQKFMIYNIVFWREVDKKKGTWFGMAVIHLSFKIGSK